MDNNKTASQRNPDEAAVTAAFLAALLNAPRKQEKPEDITSTLSDAVVDFDHVCIPRHRFEEFVRKEEQLRIVFHAYQKMNEYRVDYVLEALFGPRPKEDESGAL